MEGRYADGSEVDADIVVPRMIDGRNDGSPLQPQAAPPRQSPVRSPPSRPSVCTSLDACGVFVPLRVWLGVQHGVRDTGTFVRQARARAAGLGVGGLR